MANETYTLIQKTTLNASAASITFSSIPQTFTDLVVMFSLRTTGAVTYRGVLVTMNGATSGHTYRILSGEGSGTPGSSAESNVAYVYGYESGGSATASSFGNGSLYISNYASTSTYKSMSMDTVSESNTAAMTMGLTAGLYASNTAITSISLKPSVSENLAQYSSVSLYGVAKQGVNPVAGPKASGGDIITNDGTYWIHQFLNSGTFTPSQTLSTEYLVIAGGGGSGVNAGGGGGAGGYLTASSFSVTAQSYAITIGAGGAGAEFTPEVKGLQGSSSVFSSITAAGGGGGGIGNPNVGGNNNGGSGGSGGGASSYNTLLGTGGTATPSGQGFAGGNATAAASNFTSAGGGGSGGAAANSTASSSSTVGGIGTSSSITGTAVTRASGGSGYYQTSKSAGGGGAGQENGEVNTGGGAGGKGSGSGMKGGSGIVIIRYAI
jgi:hypothetical protein